MRIGCAVLSLLVAAATGAGAATGVPGRAADLILQAGNARDDRQRYELLREVRTLVDLPPVLAADLETLLPIAGQYAAIEREPTVPGDGVRGAENGYLCFFYLPIRQTKDTPSADYPPRIDAGSPLYPIHCLYRGRMLIWYPIQRGSIAQDPGQRAPWFEEGRRLLRVARTAYPDNPVIGMYLDAPIPWPDPAPADPAAPVWANLQRTSLEKWADVVTWWIDHRQLTNGEFGGGWGDDVELWRTWPAVLVAFQDPKIEAAQERISEGIFRLPHMQAGFMAKVFDAEHAAEDSADTITPMMLIRPEDPLWGRRAARLAELMRDVWTGPNARGQLQFKSSWIGAAGVDLANGRASDTVYHFRTMQPTLLYWLRTRDPSLTALFTRWLDTWVDVTMRAENGKPAGIPPASIRWPDGTAGGWGDDWTRAGFYDTGLYNFPAAIDEMLPNLLLAHHITGREKYLEPIIALARFQQRLLAGELGPETRGSPAWCARQTSRAIISVLPKYRALTGDTRFDALIARSANGYAAFRNNGDLTAVESALARTAQAMTSNFEAFTSEVRWTDRIQAFHGKYANLYAAQKTPGLSLETLYMMASGDLGHPAQFPMNAVRWLTPPRGIAALVTASSGQRFAARLFHFGDQPRAMSAELYGLKPGRYRMTMTADGANGAEREAMPPVAVEVKGPVTRLGFRLPARVPCEILIAP
jgi:hypothetical protein